MKIYIHTYIHTYIPQLCMFLSYKKKGTMFECQLLHTHKYEDMHAYIYTYMPQLCMFFFGVRRYHAPMPALRHMYSPCPMCAVHMNIHTYIHTYMHTYVHAYMNIEYIHTAALHVLFV
jgi:hypothetical protein